MLYVSTHSIIKPRSLTSISLSIMSCLILAFVLSPQDASAKGWEKVGTYSGVKVSRKTVEGSPLFAFRGVIEKEIPLDILMSTFIDPKQRKYWVDRYKKHVTIKKTELSETYWIHFKLPPLISDRDYVLKSDAKINKKKGVIQVWIKSVKDPKFPPDCCVRANVKKTYYRFTALSRTKTRLEVEVHTDPKGLLPNWLINLIQKKWPSKTLSGLIKQSKKYNKSHAKTRAWLEENYSTSPTKAPAKEPSPTPAVPAVNTP